VPIEVQLWAHPQCQTELDRLLQEPDAPAKSWINRTFAVLDDLIDRWSQSDGEMDMLADLRPQPLVRVNGLASALIPWPDTAEGRQFEVRCTHLELALLQVEQLRSAIAVVKFPAEIFVVWLRVEVTDAPREDGFLDDTDAAVARDALWLELGAVLDLTWLESE
jgi:hypothetical protein